MASVDAAIAADPADAADQGLWGETGPRHFRSGGPVWRAAGRRIFVHVRPGFVRPLVPRRRRAPAELGFYGLAVKLSLITALVMLPFGLWWYAQRIGFLKKRDGLEVSARAVGVGMSLLAIGAAVTCVGAPLLVQTLLPSGLSRRPALSAVAGACRGA